MSNLPKVSIIIPTFNCALFLNRAIDSVFDQTYMNIEIIVVDDGSTDNTRDIVADYRRYITYIYQENSGLAGARNTGIESAKGDYIAFLDADDCYSKYNIETKISFIENNPYVDWVYSDWDYLDEQRNFIERGSTRWSYRNKNIKDNLFKELLYNRNFISPCTVVIKKSVLKEVGCFDPMVICQEDWDLWLRLSLNHPSHFIDEVLVHVVERPYSLSKDFNKWVYGNSLIVNKLENLIPEDFPNKHAILKKLQADKYTYIGRDQMQKGEIGKAIKSYMKSVKHLPYQKRIYWLLLKALFKFSKLLPFNTL